VSIHLIRFGALAWIFWISRKIKKTNSVGVKEFEEESQRHFNLLKCYLISSSDANSRWCRFVWTFSEYGVQGEVGLTMFLSWRLFYLFTLQSLSVDLSWQQTQLGF